MDNNKKNVLSEQELGSICGGFMYYNPNGGSTPYELIDDLNGNTLAYFSSKQDCIDSAKLNNMSPREIDLNQLNQIRNRGI